MITLYIILLGILAIWVGSYVRALYILRNDIELLSNAININNKWLRYIVYCVYLFFIMPILGFMYIISGDE